MVPPSMIALRTIAYNDQVAYPWFAPAGFNRGLVTGVSSVGYLTSEGEYAPVTLNQGQRDVLYSNRINPIAYIPGRGLVVYGQKTLNPVTTALDRINVARLINYLKYNLDILAKPFMFEPNDQQTRQNAQTTVSAFMQTLQTLRAVYDFAVVCDESNNTPERIDRNELWIDIAIKPEKAIEFIYIPIRILNTGDPLPGGGGVT
jgi:phage tail sheath protein FI